MWGLCYQTLYKNANRAQGKTPTPLHEIDWLVYDTAMIGYLKGAVLHGEKNHIILLANGIGYKVFVTPDTLEAVRGKETELWIHTAVREDALDLFGFREKESLNFFNLLLSVPGIGPKSALGILGLADVRTIRQAVSSGDTSYLTKVSGIGKKTADKIVLELEGKLDVVGKDTESSEDISGEVDAIEALKSLGYNEREAQKALQKIDKDVKGASERVKAALKLLGT
jgi:Holliday junction DNA helicase RuvA